MHFKYYYISLFIILCVFLNPNTENNKYILVSSKLIYTSGASVNLEFRFEGDSDVVLYCTNSYGSILVTPKVTNDVLRFELPSVISKKSGILNWQLLTPKTNISGQLTIQPKSTINSLESYLGPPSIEAGGTDYTMLVVIPTDDLDNPLNDSTEVHIKHQFLDINTIDKTYTKHGFTHKNIHSHKKDGRILISSECLNFNSKEYDVNVMPAIPVNFSISSKRIHNYADGNQITLLKTSVIKDRHNNTVSDGTFVTFFITNKDGYKSKTTGATINGIATAKLLHPIKEEQWTIKAYIEGMANSDAIILDYQQAVSNFDVLLSKNKRLITVGPLQSFMNQRIPDGFPVTLKVYQNGILRNEITKQTYDGLAYFNLKPDRFPKGIYSFKIEAAGIEKSYTDISYEH